MEIPFDLCRSMPRTTQLVPDRSLLRLSQVPHTAYQVDFAAVNCGMFVAASKRIVRFKFGFTNPEALSGGKRGAECRGFEHEVIVTWSLSSGKQAVAFDRHEVFFDVGDSTQTKVSHSWRDENGHTFFVIAHAANLSLRTDTLLIPNPDWRQYDLFIDGVSFFRMPKIFEVGVGLSPALATRHSRDDPRESPKPEQFWHYPNVENGGDSEGEMSDHNATRAYAETVLRWADTSSSERSKEVGNSTTMTSSHNGVDDWQVIKLD